MLKFKSNLLTDLYRHPFEECLKFELVESTLEQSLNSSIDCRHQAHTIRYYKSFSF